MTSRSIASLSSLALVLLLLAAPAWAGRKVVVLEFEGPKAEKFHDDVEAAIAKSATVVSLDKWLAKADDLDALKVNARNIKKVARKLKVDGVVMGEVEKRGQRYYLHLKLREGISGEYVAEVEIVVRSPKLGKDGAASIKEELIPAIKELMSISGDDEEDEEDEEEPRAKKKPKGKNSGFGGGRTSDDEEDEEDEEDEDEEEDVEEEDEEDEPKAKKPKAKAKKPKAKAKAKAKAKTKNPDPDEEEEEEVEAQDDDDDEDRVADEDDEDFEDDESIERSSRDDDGEDFVVDPRSRAVDVSAGMSVTARRLGFTTANGTGPVQGYRGNPVAGAVISATAYPLAFNKNNQSITRDFGLTLLLDRVVKISSKIKYDDMGTEETAVLGTVQQRISVGVVFRHLIGDKASIIGSVRFNKMKFVIDKADAPAGVVVQIPNVDYTFIDPGVAVKYLAGPKLVVDAGASFALVLGTGEMQEPEQFGTSKVLGFDFTGGASYAVTEKILVRAEARATTFGFAFSGNGTMNDLDGDGMGDVPSGRDTYFGALVAAGYIF